MSAALEKSLDDIIGEKQSQPRRGSGRRETRGRQAPYARNGRSDRSRDDFRDSDERGPDRARWSHDRYSPRRTHRDESDSYRPRRASIEDRPARLKVDNIHYDLTEREVRDLFEKIAPVVRFSMPFDRSGRSEGVCYVTYENYADARLAISRYDGQSALGQRLVVQMDSPPPRREGRDLASRISIASREKRTGGATRGGRGARSARGASTTAKRGPVSAADLDAELDSFMAQRNGAQNEETAPSASAVAVEGGNDGMQID